MLEELAGARCPAHLCSLHPLCPFPPPLPVLPSCPLLPRASAICALSPPSNPRAPPSPAAIRCLVLGWRNVSEAGALQGPVTPPRQVLGVKEVAILWCADRRLLLLIMLSMIRSHTGPMGPAAEQGACGRCTCGEAGSPWCRLENLK